jgi:hypothetical protein
VLPVVLKPQARFAGVSLSFHTGLALVVEDSNAHPSSDLCAVHAAHRAYHHWSNRRVGDARSRSIQAHISFRLLPDESARDGAADWARVALAIRIIEKAPTPPGRHMTV